MILLIGGEKGGTGKSTLAVNLAAMRVNAGHDVLMVDCDPQASSTIWTDVRAEEQPGLRQIPIVQKLGNAIAKDIKSLAVKYEDVIIDVGGRESVELRAALVVAEKLLSPIQPSQFDTWTLTQLSEVINHAQAINPDLDVMSVISRVSTNPSLRASEVEMTREYLEEFDTFNVLSTEVYERVVYRRSIPQGLAVTEYDPKDSKAINEVESVYEVIYG